MTKFSKILAYTAIAISFASPVSAEFIHLYRVNFDLTKDKVLKMTDHDGKGGIVDANYTCDSSKGEYSTKPQNATCTQKGYPGGTRCYVDCSCSTSSYPYSAADCIGNFVPSGDTCSDGNQTYYAQCSCADGLTNVAPTAAVYGAFNVPDPAEITSTSGNKLQCYNPKAYTCKNETNNFPMSESAGFVTDTSDYEAVIKSTSEPIYYNVVSNLVLGKISDPDFKLCAVGVSNTLPKGVFLKESTNNKRCATYVTRTAAHYPNTTYYYYDGNCKQNNECTTPTGNDAVCSITTSESFDWYDYANQENRNGLCSYVSGCRIGDPATGSRGICVATDDVSSIDGAFRLTSYQVPGDTTVCVNITDCNYPYGLVEITTTLDPGDYDSATSWAQQDINTGTIFDVKSINSGVSSIGNYGYAVCRQATSCMENLPDGKFVCEYTTATANWQKLLASSSSNCDALGYTQTIEQCNGKPALKCPSDVSKVHCDAEAPIPCEMGMLYDSAIGGCTKDNTGDFIVIATSPYGKCDILSLSGTSFSTKATGSSLSSQITSACSSKGMSVMDTADAIAYADMKGYKNIIPSPATHAITPNDQSSLNLTKMMLQSQTSSDTSQYYGYSCIKSNVDCLSTSSAYYLSDIELTAQICAAGNYYTHNNCYIEQADEPTLIVSNTTGSQGVLVHYVNLRDAVASLEFTPEDLIGDARVAATDLCEASGTTLATVEELIQIQRSGSSFMGRIKSKASAVGAGAYIAAKDGCYNLNATSETDPGHHVCPSTSDMYAYPYICVSEDTF